MRIWAEIFGGLWVFVCGFAVGVALMRWVQREQRQNVKDAMAEMIYLARPILRDGLCVACWAQVQGSPAFVEHNPGCEAMAQHNRLKAFADTVGSV